MNIILIGAPGAGKGTQARRLSALLGVPHIASGDLFRDIARLDTAEAREVRECMERGEYVPDDLTIDIVFARLRQPDARRGFILDGFPRTERQAEALDHKLTSHERGVDVALNIRADPDVLLSRIAGRLVCPNCKAIYNISSNPPRVDGICDVCGHRLERRADEASNVVATRLETYEKQTRPVIAYYRQRGTLREIDGTRPIGIVDAEIDEIVGLGTVTP